MAEGVWQPGEKLAATFKSTPVGCFFFCLFFFPPIETGNTKTFTIKRSPAEGGLLIIQSEEEKIQRKTWTFAIMCSECWLQASVVTARPHFP